VNSMNFVNDHQKSRLLYYICYLQREIKKKKESKENYYYFATKKIENQKTSLKTKHKKQKCKREEICVPFNLRKIIIIIIYIGGFLIYTYYNFDSFFWCSKKKVKNN